MNDLSLHILDVSENCIQAGAKNIEIKVNEDLKNDLLTIEINDDGKGMSEEMIKQNKDPFITSRKTRKVGLGIPFLIESAKICEGDVNISSVIGKGTKVKAFFKYSHIDRKPIGNIAESLIALILLSEETDIKYVHSKNGKEFEFDTKDLKVKLNLKSLKEASLIIKLKELINQKILELR